MGAVLFFVLTRRFIAAVGSGCLPRTRHDRSFLRGKLSETALLLQLEFSQPLQRTAAKLGPRLTLLARFVFEHVESLHLALPGEVVLTYFLGFTRHARKPELFLANQVEITILVTKT